MLFLFAVQMIHVVTERCVDSMDVTWHVLNPFSVRNLKYGYLERFPWHHLEKQDPMMHHTDPLDHWVSLDHQDRQEFQVPQDLWDQLDLPDLPVLLVLRVQMDPEVSQEP
jgi:hypothetical protein